MNNETAYIYLFSPIMCQAYIHCMRRDLWLYPVKMNTHQIATKILTVRADS